MSSTDAEDGKGIMKARIVFACVLLWAGWAAADETVIDVTYSHRQVPSGNPPDTSIAEGSILATFTASNPGDLPPGIHDVPWDGTDRFGARVSSGVYFFRLDTDRRVCSRKAVLLQ